MDMQMLYDSDDFCVIHIPYAGTEGFEIINKHKDRGIFLVGQGAQAFDAQIKKWQEDIPEQDAVERILDRYTILAQNPLVLH